MIVPIASSAAPGAAAALIMPFPGYDEASVLKASAAAEKAHTLQQAFALVAATDRHTTDTPSFSALLHFLKYNAEATQAHDKASKACTAANAAIDALKIAQQNAEEAIVAAKADLERACHVRALAFYEHTEVRKQQLHLVNPHKEQHPRTVHFTMSGCGCFMPDDMRGFLQKYGTDASTDTGHEGVLYARVTLNEGVKPLDMFKDLVKSVPNAMPHS